MDRPHPFALFRTQDQWMRASHHLTTLDLEADCVTLAWKPPTESAAEYAASGPGAGLAFDPFCRLYHSLPEEGRVARILWAAALAPGATPPAPLDLFAAVPPPVAGDFSGPAPASMLARPVGLAFDAGGRLFIAESGADRVLLFDLDARRLERTIAFPGEAPTDLSWTGDSLLIVLSTSGRVMRLRGRGEAVPFELPPGSGPVSRIASSPAGRIAFLERAGEAAARVCLLGDSGIEHAETIAFATDLEWLCGHTLVIARGRDQDFVVRRCSGGVYEKRPPLRAHDYDGRGIVATPEGEGGGSACGSRRILYCTVAGTIRHAVAERLRYERGGTVTSYRLDSGEFQTVWGRLFVEACVPPGSTLRVRFECRDEPDESVPAETGSAPVNIDRSHLAHWEVTPPLPPSDAFVGAPDSRYLHRRESGRELPWSVIPPLERYAVYETPIPVPPGRFLWVQLELTGNTRVTPRVRALRAEHPGHDYLRKLPRVYSRDPASAGFLRRYLSIFEGLLGDLESRSVHRDVLLDPRGAPAEVLPWLAGFFGLVLDERWSRAPRPGGRTIDARRDLVRDVEWLFRFRGTLPGLRRFIRHYTGVSPVLIEHFRLRGLGGGMVSGDEDAFSNSVLGAGFRVGGATGSAEKVALDGTVDDAFATHAHRFTVVIPAALDEEQLDVVNHILEVHRPSHTLFTACTIAAGMRIGRGLHIGLSSIVGPSDEFVTVQIGDSPLGRGGILGRPAETHAAAGSMRVGRGGRI